MIPESYKKYAKAFFQIAKKDFERAKKMFELKDYSMCVFFSQQAIEKSVKAMLETKLFFIREHNILPYFVEKFKDEWKEEFNIIVEALDHLKFDWVRTRYPFEMESIILPEEYYDENKARKALIYAGRVLEIVEKYLKEKNVL